jgi:hypothetical protein
VQQKRSHGRLVLCTVVGIEGPRPVSPEGSIISMSGEDILHLYVPLHPNLLFRQVLNQTGCTKQNHAFCVACLVHPVGIEPTSQDPESCVLSIERWVPSINYKLSASKHQLCKSPLMAGFCGVNFVHSLGIEPKLQDPQSCVLSIERRVQVFLASLPREKKKSLNASSRPALAGSIERRVRTYQLKIKKRKLSMTNNKYRAFALYQESSCLELQHFR